MARILRSDIYIDNQGFVDLSWGTQTDMSLGCYLSRLIPLLDTLESFDVALQVIEQSISLVVNQCNPLTKIEMQRIIDTIKTHWGDFIHLTFDGFDNIFIQIRLKDLQAIIDAKGESVDVANGKKEKMIAIINAINKLHRDSN